MIMSKTIKLLSEQLLKPVILALIIVFIIICEIFLLESLKTVSLSVINYVLTVGVACTSFFGLAYCLRLATIFNLNGTLKTICMLLILVPTSIDQLGILFNLIFYGGGDYHFFGILNKTASAVFVQLVHLLLIGGTTGLYYISVQKANKLKEMESMPHA